MADLKVALLGAGNISDAHFGAWAQIPEAKVVAVCDVRAEQAEAGARRVSGRAYTDFEQLLAAEDVDIVDICLPTYLHADYAVRALKAGKHVLCEKPLSLKEADIPRVFAAAKKANRRFMVAQVLRFWPEYELLRQVFEDGRYGKLLSGSMTRIGRTPQKSWENWMLDEGKSGLVPCDLHIHDLDFLVYAFGRPQGHAHHRARGGRRDELHVTYAYPGFFVSCQAAWNDCDYPFSSAFRFAFEGALLEYKGGELVIYEKGRAGRAFGEASSVFTGETVPTSNAYLNEIRYFTDCVLAGQDCGKVGADSLGDVLRIIQELR